MIHFSLSAAILSSASINTQNRDPAEQLPFENDYCFGLDLSFVTSKFNKPVIVVETGYYSEPSDYFEKKGVQGAFPETPEGQMNWFKAVNEIVMDVDNNMGLGVFWWEPMFRGRGFFDDSTNMVKPIVDAFRQYTFPMQRNDGNPRIWDFEDWEE